MQGKGSSNPLGARGTGGIAEQEKQVAAASRPITIDDIWRIIDQLMSDSPRQDQEHHQSYHAGTFWNNNAESDPFSPQYNFVDPYYAEIMKNAMGGRIYNNPQLPISSDDWINRWNQEYSTWDEVSNTPPPAIDWTPRPAIRSSQEYR